MRTISYDNSFAFQVAIKRRRTVVRRVSESQTVDVRENEEFSGVSVDYDSVSGEQVISYEYCEKSNAVESKESRQEETKEIDITKSSSVDFQAQSGRCVKSISITIVK